MLNIDEDTRQVTKFNYIADVSGLFSYSDAPEYIEYNPSSNYVGYGTDVIYTPSSVVNNYRYKISDGGDYDGTLNFSYNDVYSWDYQRWDDYSDVRLNYTGSTFSTLFEDSYTQYGQTFNIDIWTHITPDDTPPKHIQYVTKLSNILDNLNIPSSIESGTLIYHRESNYPVFFYPGDWNTVVGDGRNRVVAEVNDDNYPTYMEVDMASELVTAYRGSTIVWQKQAENVAVIGWYASYEDVNTEADVSGYFTFYGVGYPVYGYMQPTAGVKATSTSATWQNGYDNSVIDVKIIKNGDVNTPYQGTSFDLGSDFGIDITMTGNKISIYYGAISDPSDWTLREIGNWLGIQMRIDALSGNIILTPTNDVNLMTTVEPTAYSITLEGVLTPGTLTSFKVETANNGAMPSMKFQVTDTWVFLNTYNTVMIDPSITVTDYFPSLSEYRLNFYSFALIGNSMTINGQVCPIDRDNGTITFENVAGFTFTKKLENFYLTYDTNVTITFVNDGSSYDLGELTDDEVSFDGMWYFVTGLYEPYEATEYFWNWNLDGFQASAGECLLLFLGIIGAGVVVYTVFGKGKLGYLDWIVIIFAVFLGSCFLGF